MDIQSTQTISYTVTLTDEDVARILIDPADFQKQLRAIRAGQNKGKHGAKNPIISKRPAGAKAGGG